MIRTEEQGQPVVIPCPKENPALKPTHFHVCDTRKNSLENYKGLLMKGPPDNPRPVVRDMFVPTPSPLGKLAHLPGVQALRLDDSPKPSTAAVSVAALTRGETVTLPAPVLAAPPPPSRPEPRGFACRSGKAGYATQGIAESMLKSMQKRGLSVVRAYECEGCGRWHLTSEKVRRDHTQITYDEIAVLAQSGVGNLTIRRGTWPDGKLARVVIETPHGDVRVLHRNLPLLAGVIDMLLEENAAEADDDAEDDAETTQ